MPTYRTPRNLSRDTIAASLIETSRLLRYEPMPWVVDAYNTIGEVDERGRLFYSEVRVGTPRQQSKTTGLTFVRHVDRMLHAEERGWPDDQVAAFAMQHGSDARAKMTRIWQPRVERAAFPEWIRNLRGSGTESIEWHNGRMIPFAPNGVAIHGDVLDDVSLDEAWAFHEDGRAEAGARPAMITRASSQLLISSTAGTNESTYWKAKCDDGEQRVLANDDGRVYYLSYAADLTKDDVHNPEHWPRWMPALGYTIEMEAVQLEHDTISEEAWLRSYCNIAVGTTDAIIPASAWTAAIAEKTVRDGPVFMAVDIAPAPDGSGRSASIAVASWRDNEIHVLVLEHGAGTAWIADRVGELTRQRTVTLLVVDSVGPIGSVLPQIKAKAACKIEVLETAGALAACGSFFDGLVADPPTIRHANQDVLNAAVAGASKRVVGDRWGWARSRSSADISPLVAATLAAWACTRNPPRGPIKMYTR